MDMAQRIQNIKSKNTDPKGSIPILIQDSKGSVLITIPAHPGVISQQAFLQNRGWSETRQSLLSVKDKILRISGNMDKELGRIVERFRSSMSFGDRLRQTFSAALNVIPATAAVTYILHTGDPIGAAGIKVKLTGLLGLKDLYALVAIPVTAGVKQADMKQLQTILEPLAKAWFDDKLNMVETLFKEAITGKIFQTGQLLLSEAQEKIRRIESDLESIR
jgi:hypothetical protein